MGCVADVDGVVEDLEEALGRRYGVQEAHPTLCRGAYGLVDRDHDEDEGRQLAERDPATHHHRDADEEHGDGGRVIDQLHEGARQYAVLDHLHGAAEESAGRSREGFALESFGPECLDQLDAAVFGFHRALDVAGQRIAGLPDRADGIDAPQRADRAQDIAAQARERIELRHDGPDAPVGRRDRREPRERLGCTLERLERRRHVIGFPALVVVIDDRQRATGQPVGPQAAHLNQ